MHYSLTIVCHTAVCLPPLGHRLPSLSCHALCSLLQATGTLPAVDAVGMLGSLSPPPLLAEATKGAPALPPGSVAPSPFTTRSSLVLEQSPFAMRSPPALASDMDVDPILASWDSNTLHNPSSLSLAGILTPPATLNLAGGLTSTPSGHLIPRPSVHNPWAGGHLTSPTPFALGMLNTRDSQSEPVLSHMKSCFEVVWADQQVSRPGEFKKGHCACQFGLTVWASPMLDTYIACLLTHALFPIPLTKNANKYLWSSTAL